MTALYDALGVYLDGAFAQDGRKVLLLYTDGGDTRSRMRLGELLDLVRASDVTVYAIGFQTQLRVADRMMERLRLEEIVGLTGGLGMGLGAYLFVYAIAEAGVGKVATLTSISPLFGMAMAVVFLKEQVTWQMVVGMGLCLAGVWVVI